MDDKELEIEKERLAIERNRLSIERERLELENRVFQKHFGAIITAVVSLFGMVVAGTQVWIADIGKTQQEEIAKLSRDQESSRLERQHEKDWNLQVAKFISEHRKEIFSGSKSEREQIANIMRATFPPNIYNVAFGKFAGGSTDQNAREMWRGAQNILPITTSGAGSSKIQGASPAVDTLIPKVTASPVAESSKSNPLYDFRIWLDLSETQKGQIREVEYKFNHPSFSQKTQVSTDATKGFQVGYRGWGAIDSVPIKVTYRDGQIASASVDMLKALGW